MNAMGRRVLDRANTTQMKARRYPLPGRTHVRLQVLRLRHSWTPTSHSPARPFRVLRSGASSPHRAMAAPAPAPRVGLLYDDRMCAHATPDGEEHPENPERLRAIWRKLNAAGVASRYGARGRSPAPLCRARSVVVLVGMGGACTAHRCPWCSFFRSNCLERNESLRRLCAMTFTYSALPLLLLWPCPFRSDDDWPNDCVN